MKKLSIIALLICALCMCTVAVSAEITVAPKMETKSLVSVQVEGTANADDKVTLLAIEGAMDADGSATTELQKYTEDELATLLTKVTYIDQKTASDNAASFSFVPRNAVNTIADNTISLYASDGNTTAVKAMSTLMTYTVSFESAGTVCKTIEVAENTNLLEAVTGAAYAPPSNFGYTFTGEWTLKDGAAISDSATVTGDVTVCAKWAANFAEFTTDTGYCTTVDGEETVKTGVISVLAKPSTAVLPEGYTTYGNSGFYVWRGQHGPTDAWTSISNKIHESAGNVGTGSFFGIVTDIPEDKYSEGVVILPYSYYYETQNKRLFGVPKLVKLEGELKNLGDLEALKAELAAAKDAQ